MSSMFCHRPNLEQPETRDLKAKILAPMKNLITSEQAAEMSSLRSPPKPARAAAFLLFALEATLAILMAIMTPPVVRGADAPSGAAVDQFSDALATSYIEGKPLRIGNEVQLLLDDYMVEDRWKLTRENGKVIKHLRNPIIVQERPWEGELGGLSVLFDPKLGKYRMWYEGFNVTSYFSHEGPSYYVCYAESDDAFTWTKPELEGFPFGPYPRTNVVTAGREGRRAGAIQVIFNPDQSDPAKRFMMVYVGDGVDIAYSPDGLHWNVREKPLLPFHSDTANNMTWVPERKLWYLYGRPNILPNGWSQPRVTHLIPVPEGLRHTGRRMSLTTSPDLENWSTPRTIFPPDERSQPDFDRTFVFRRHGVFMTIYSEMFQENGAHSETEPYFASSRDGVRWEHTWDRKPFIPLGPPGSIDHGQIEVANSPPLDIGEDMLIYYSVSPNGQSSIYDEPGIGVCRVRRDRFVAQHAGDQTGFLLTRQFVLEGTQLKINCSALPYPYFQKESDGIRVSIIAAPDYKTKETTWETSLPGFSLADCDPIVTDSTSYVVKWKGSPDLSSLKGRAVYLRFQMKHADLYSFQIAP